LILRRWRGRLRIWIEIPCHRDSMGGKREFGERMGKVMIRGGLGGGALV